MSVLYTHLTYEQFKSLETQMKAFRETTHTTTGGFYHKSIRLKVTDDLIMEFHAPMVGGYGHVESREDAIIRKTEERQKEGEPS